MKILQNLTQTKSSFLINKNLEEIFNFLLTEIEGNKGNLQLVNIFDLIGEELQKNKINSIICIINHRGDEVIVRQVNFPGEFKNIFTTKNIKAINFKKFYKYQEVIKKKKAVYCENRIGQFKKLIPQTAQVFKNSEKINSIIAPMILRGEIIATLEILSSKIESNNLNIVEEFVKKLVISITNNILFHEIGESERRYRDLFENSNNGLVFFDVEKKYFRESNLAMKKISGYTVEELKQLHYPRLFTKDDRRKIIKIINSIKDGNKKILPVQFCAKIKTKNNKIKIVDVSLGLQTKRGEICFNFNDITKNKLAEEENNKLKEFNQKIVENSPVSILVLNKKGDIILANDMAKKITKKKNQDLLKKNLLKMKEIKGNKELKEKYKAVLKDGQSFCYDNLSYISEIDGKKKSLNIKAVPLYDKQFKVDGVISMAIDNTEVIIAKEKMEKMNKNLEQTVKERTKELNKVLELKSKFISDASHELRTPLTIIQGNLDLVKKERQQKNKDIPEAHVLISREVEQMIGILSDLTMLTNIDVSNETLDYDDINLNLLVLEVKQALNVLAHKKNIDLLIEENKKNIFIVGDETKIEKLLLNIVRNAIKYTEKGGKIKLWIEESKNFVKIFIKDNGIGIPENDIPYIFERFYRVDKSRSRSEGGTGLGLSICKWIAEAHGGDIKVESKLGSGSVFIVSLPYKHK